MYYPYLRGKQFELLALREFSGQYVNNDRIIPIIEPVKEQVKGLNQTVKALIDNGMKFAVVLNPKEGDFKHPNVDNDILDSIGCLADDRSHWIPAYIYKNNAQRLLEHAESKDLSRLMIIFPSGADVNDDALMDFLSNDRISYIVYGNLGNNRSARCRMLNLGKLLISLEDRFNDRPRNADYQEQVDEIFSEDFAFYEYDGLAGFADYTPLPKDFVEGGMLPYAIAIHLTYRKSEDQIFVHHFVSEHNFDQSDICGKFHEAAQQIGPFYEENELYHTSAVDEFIMKSTSDDGYPGLGYIKKLSIKNHLELIYHIIPERQHENM
ncbi:MAG: sce7725 family protein [Bacteroidaceae bacterium]|nr:sce7725 family protein [Bacteroidaceae bacterium]